jgi:DNA-binding PadR family transcriptional regulator
MMAVGSAKEKILKEIGKGPIHGYALANRVGVSLTFIYQHLKDLREGGFVEFREENRRRVYVLTAKGKHLLKAIE